jgi:hypothetical protein
MRRTVSDRSLSTDPTPLRLIAGAAVIVVA